MSIENLASHFLKSGDVSPALEERLRSPADRLAIYKLAAGREQRDFRLLLLRLFNEEIAFREALWEGAATDDGTCSEGIFHCAFLIHCCGVPSDTEVLWEAQYLNQDVGELDGEYFVGAGVAETLAHLREIDDQTCAAIAEYIVTWSRHTSPDSLSEWQNGRRQWILES
ncbi:hypothetical protein [Ideonella livida]|uniref:Uncharacterized protein n=1 Tax=Ideonella livida TaxID=2707176 RepID=A0A7C9PJX8_9BURK|nr:hypothetical protein [Ideonella livida]NDY93793.1 hypothetical protein [Ideonella livida]